MAPIWNQVGVNNLHGINKIQQISEKYESLAEEFINYLENCSIKDILTHIPHPNCHTSTKS
jgi:hypothetical protein